MVVVVVVEMVEAVTRKLPPPQSPLYRGKFNSLLQEGDAKRRE